MSDLTFARPPYQALPVTTVADAYKELRRVQQQQQGLFVPRVLTAELSPYAVVGTDDTLVADATDGAIVVTLPDAARVNGQRLTVLKSDSSAHAITISGTVSGVANPSLVAQYDALVIVAANGTWYQLSQYP